MYHVLKKILYIFHYVYNLMNLKLYKITHWRHSKIKLGKVTFKNWTIL